MADPKELLVYPEQYGADPDGILDSTQAFKDAIVAAQTLAGNEPASVAIYLSSMYRIEEQLVSGIAGQKPCVGWMGRTTSCGLRYMGPALDDYVLIIQGQHGNEGIAPYWALMNFRIACNNNCRGVLFNRLSGNARIARFSIEDAKGIGFRATQCDDADFQGVNLYNGNGIQAYIDSMDYISIKNMFINGAAITAAGDLPSGFSETGLVVIKSSHNINMDTIGFIDSNVTHTPESNPSFYLGSVANLVIRNAGFNSTAIHTHFLSENGSTQWGNRFENIEFKDAYTRGFRFENAFEHCKIKAKGLYTALTTEALVSIASGTNLVESNEVEATYTNVKDQQPISVSGTNLLGNIFNGSLVPDTERKQLPYQQISGGRYPLGSKDEYPLAYSSSLIVDWRDSFAQTIDCETNTSITLEFTDPSFIGHCKLSLTNIPQTINITWPLNVIGAPGVLYTDGDLNFYFDGTNYIYQPIWDLYSAGAFGMIIRPEKHGADPTGLRDSTQALLDSIAEAEAAVATAPGQVIILLAGIYNTSQLLSSGTVDTPGSIGWVGETPSAGLNYTGVQANGHLLTIAGTYPNTSPFIGARQIRLNCNNLCAGLHMNRSRNHCDIRHVSIIESRRIGLHLDNTYLGIVENIRFQNCTEISLLCNEATRSWINQITTRGDISDITDFPSEYEKGVIVFNGGNSGTLFGVMDFSAQNITGPNAAEVPLININKSNGVTLQNIWLENCYYHTGVIINDLAKKITIDKWAESTIPGDSTEVQAVLLNGRHKNHKITIDGGVHSQASIHAEFGANGQLSDCDFRITTTSANNVTHFTYNGGIADPVFNSTIDGSPISDLHRATKDNDGLNRDLPTPPAPRYPLGIVKEYVEPIAGDAVNFNWKYGQVQTVDCTGQTNPLTITFADQDWPQDVRITFRNVSTPISITWPGSVVNGPATVDADSLFEFYFDGTSYYFKQQFPLV